jgi:NADH-quinone oxidoreductase subunit J
MNPFAFVIIGILTLAGALAAATLPRLIHAALSLVLAFIGVASFYFLLGAEFVGLIQILVYVGAVAVLIVFTILLTRRAKIPPAKRINWNGLAVGLGVFGMLMWALFASDTGAPPSDTVLTVKQIGEVLMTDYIWPLETIGLLLTAALIGALMIVLEEKP